jgi:LacI family transcriptional regulator, purine nucleotide synthesis repressor
MSVTIKDIAKLAGVSHTTVSRSLNDSSLISDKTKKRIKEIATKQGYTPNNNAKCLVLNKSFNIGVFITTLNFGVTPDYFFQVVRTLQKLLKGKYKLVVRGIDDYKEEDYFLINRKTFDGIITITQDSQDDKFIHHIERIKLPHVIINRKFNSTHTDCIYSNEKETVKTAIEYLIENGHSKICFVKGTNNFTSTKDRLSGYVEALRKNSIAFNENYILEGDYNINSGYKAMENILRLTPLPTAIFFGSDNMALGALKCIQENNLSVPENFSIIGFDNTEFSSYLTPSLTTIERPNEEIVTDALNCLILRIDEKDSCPTISKCITSTFIKRKSVKII